MWIMVVNTTLMVVHEKRTRYFKLVMAIRHSCNHALLAFLALVLKKSEDYIFINLSS